MHRWGTAHTRAESPPEDSPFLAEESTELAKKLSRQSTMQLQRQQLQQQQQKVTPAAHSHTVALLASMRGSLLSADGQRSHMQRKMRSRLSSLAVSTVHGDDSRKRLTDGLQKKPFIAKLLRKFLGRFALRKLLPLKIRRKCWGVCKLKTFGAMDGHGPCG